MLNILKIFENIVQRNEKELLNLSSGTITIKKSIYYQNSVRIHVTTFQGKLQSFWYLNQLKLLFILLDLKKKGKSGCGVVSGLFMIELELMRIGEWNVL